MDTSSSASTSSSVQAVTFYDFLDRMRNPLSLDLVRSIKSFIVSFSFHAANSEMDGKRLQDFLLKMESATRDHPLWVGATEDEIDSAMEGLEKYVMTKLFSRTFVSSPEDAKIDLEVSEKIDLLKNFLKPEHLDIPPALQNEASWLLAEKELQKMNAFKAPREKLLCIQNCCRVINNLLMNASLSENHKLGGADDFLPVLIYLTIKANPPQLHSNLKYIQLYRRQEKLVSEAAYYFTNLISVKSFILDLDAKSLSIDEIEFEESMKAATLAKSSKEIESLPGFHGTAALAALSSTKIFDGVTNVGDGPKPLFMEAEAGELTVADVERLLSLYKDVVTKYTSLTMAFEKLGAAAKRDTRTTVPQQETGTIEQSDTTE